MFRAVSSTEAGLSWCDRCGVEGREFWFFLGLWDTDRKLLQCFFFLVRRASDSLHLSDLASVVVVRCCPGVR